MKLSILVTHYNEEWETCKSLFESIALQQGIDFKDIEVIVVNDGMDKHIEEYRFAKYPFGVKQIDTKHKGVSACRNLALDNASGDYVMFCDIDDMFISMYGLHLIFQSMQENCDIIVGSFIEELVRDGESKILRHDKDMTFIHGKAYNRQFLINNHLRFCPRLTIHEDGYFNTLSIICSETSKMIENPFYLWKWNDKSVVRKDDDGKFLMKTYENLLDARTEACRELNKRGFIAEYFDAVDKTVIDAYYEFNKSEYLDKNNEMFLKKGEKAFKKFYSEFGKDYKESSLNRIAEIMQMSRTNAFATGLKVEQTTINEWLNHITKEVK